MGLYLESLATEVLLLFTGLAILVFLYYYNAFQYWKRKKVIHLTPYFPFGNMKDFLIQKLSFGEHVKNIYKELKSKGAKYGGFYAFGSPMFMPVDPEMVKQIMIKDFSHFQDKGLYFNDKDDPLSAHLFTLDGPKWRNLRVKLTPTFTSGKMKNMFNTLIACGEHLEDNLDDTVRKGEPIDIKDIGARFTTDIISLCAFGLENFSLKDPDNEFRKYGKMIFDSTFIRKMSIQIGSLLPTLAKFLHITTTNKEAASFFIGAIKQTVEYREKNNILRNDMLNLLIKLKNNQALDSENLTGDAGGKKSGNALTFNELAAQCFVFFIAGYETSSTTMCYALLELCQNQDIQDKVRDEVKQVLKKYNGELTYDAISEMTYLEKVINETLRKYPPVPLLHRMCIKDWQVPGTDIVIEKNTKLFISNYGLHMDPEYYPNPDKFDPERFSDEEKSKRPAFTHLPFGDGPRNCIGMRFGMMQTKVGLSIFLKKYRFKLDPKTILPICYDRNLLILSCKQNIWLQAEKL